MNTDETKLIDVSQKEMMTDFEKYVGDYFPISYDHHQIYVDVFKRVWGRLHNILHPEFHYEFLRYLIVELSKCSIKEKLQGD